MKRKLSIKSIAILITLILALLLPYATASATAPTWVAKASMSTARYDFSSVVADEKFYAIGGYSGSNYLPSMEVYDPTSNTWTSLASMTSSRGYGQAEVVGEKIYAIGGISAPGVVESSMECYNTSTNTWTIMAPMSVARFDFRTAVINGKIYAIGGSTTIGLTSSVEVYDPSANTWTALSSMSSLRRGFASVVINSNIYVFGGYSSGNGITPTAEVYDPSTNTWAPLASMTSPRYHLQAEVIDGKIYVFGGNNSNGRLSSCEVYNPSVNAWTTLASMVSPREFFSAEVIDAKIYVIGGFSNEALSSSEMYDPATNTWNTLSSMISARYHLETSVLGGKIYAIGGTNPNGTLASVEAYAVITAPGAPTLTATAGDAQVTLNWNSVTDAANYNVYRSVTSGGTYTQIATGVAGTTYTDSVLTNGTTYYYIVTAVNFAGESAYSNEVSATPGAAWNALLTITLTTGEHKEYDLTAGQIGDFIEWHNDADSPSYAFTKTYNLGTLTSRRDNIAFSKIAFFEVMAYEDEPSSASPSPATKNVLLKVTMSTGDKMEYEMTNTELGTFTTWYDSGAVGSPAYAIEKVFNPGPFISRTDYLVFDEITDFEVFAY